MGNQPAKFEARRKPLEAVKHLQAEAGEGWFSAGVGASPVASRHGDTAGKERSLWLVDSRLL